jgi:hypothetical protein
VASRASGQRILDAGAADFGFRAGYGFGECGFAFDAVWRGGAWSVVGDRDAELLGAGRAAPLSPYIGNWIDSDEIEANYCTRGDIYYENDISGSYGATGVRSRGLFVFERSAR